MSIFLFGFKSKEQTFFIKETSFAIGTGASDFAWSPDGSRIAVHYMMLRYVKLYSVPKGKELGRLSNLAGAHSGIEFSSNEDVVVALKDDALKAAFSVWNLMTGQSTPVVSTDPLANILERKVDDFSINRKKNLLGGIRIKKTGKGSTTRIVIYDTKTWHVLHEYEQNTTQFDISPDDTKIVTIAKNGTVNIIDLKTGKIILEFKVNENRVKEVRWSMDGKRVATIIASTNGYGFKDSTDKPGELTDKDVLQLWNAETGKRITAPSIDLGSGMISFDFSPNGKWLVTVSADRTCRLWDAYNLEHLGIIAKVSPFAKVRFSDDSSRIAILKADNDDVAIFGNKNVPLVGSKEELKIIPKHKDESPEGIEKTDTALQELSQWEQGENKKLIETAKSLNKVKSMEEVSNWYKKEMENLNETEKDPKKFLEKSAKLQQHYQIKLQKLQEQK